MAIPKMQADLGIVVYIQSPQNLRKKLENFEIDQRVLRLI
jgi:hypothetical protein